MQVLGWGLLLLKRPAERGREFGIRERSARADLVASNYRIIPAEVLKSRVERKLASMQAAGLPKIVYVDPDGNVLGPGETVPRTRAPELM